MPHPLLIFSQSNCLIQVVDTNLHTEWQTVQIQINWLLQKRTDQDLQCLQRQGTSGFSWTRVKDTAKVLKFQTLYSIPFWPILLFMQMFLKILSRMANSVDSDQTAPSGADWSGSALSAKGSVFGTYANSNDHDKSVHDLISWSDKQSNLGLYCLHRPLP